MWNQGTDQRGCVVWKLGRWVVSWEYDSRRAEECYERPHYQLRRGREVYGPFLNPGVPMEFAEWTDAGRPRMRIGLVACASLKLGHAAPAGELYTSELFKKARRRVEQTCDRWFILSARYGLLSPAAVVEPYDLTLSTFDAAGRLAWGRRVAEDMHTTGLAGAAVWEVHAGADYSRPLAAALPAVAFDDPLKGLPIGERLAWYKAREAGEAAPASRQPSLPGV